MFTLASASLLSGPGPLPFQPMKRRFQPIYPPWSKTGNKNDLKVEIVDAIHCWLFIYIYIFFFVSSFYNYKSFENLVAPNVALTPPTPQKVITSPLCAPAVPRSTQALSSPAQSRKRRPTAELHPPPEAPAPLVTTQGEDKESETEIEVESREEGKCELSFMFVNYPFALLLGLGQVDYASTEMCRYTCRGSSH